MSKIIVDISAGEISGNPEDEIITYSLGSCLGITVFDPVVGIGGMIHCMLPLSKTDREKAKIKPYMFVDTGMSMLLSELFQMGVTRENAIVQVAGGARSLDKKNLFKIGERNFTVLRKILWKNNMLIKSKDVGSNKTRTVRMDIATGNVYVKSGGIETLLGHQVD
jgi:chemotaxis protein CheD